jgi:thioredoxin 1
MVELNRDNYESEVKESDLPVLVDFWGPRCVPCLNLMPKVEEMAKEHEGRLKVAKLNATENRMLCARMQVMGLPTFLLYKGGEEIGRISGQDLTIAAIRELVSKAL